MKAAIISLGSESSKWTYEAMQKYFEEVAMISLKELDARLGSEAGPYHNGKPLKDYDCVYVKGSFRYGHLLHAISALLEGKCYLPVAPSAFTIVHNKLLTHLELQRHNIPMPRTYILSGIPEAKGFLKTVNYPIIMKFPEGTQGKGVMIADSQGSASSMLDALGALKQPFIIQEYIDSGDVDIRAFVIGDTVVAGMMRVAQGGENRANVHAGGIAKPYALDREEKMIAVETARALKAEVCGVDLLHGSKGPLVIEANISPGLQGITSATKVDIADKIAKFLHKKTEEFLGKKRSKETMKLIKENFEEENEIITNLSFKGDRIVLPEVVTRITGFKESSEYILKSRKGRLEIEDFGIKRV